MKKITLLILLTLCSLQITAQQIKISAPKPFGGYNALISKIDYDEELAQAQIEGTVVVRFSINEKGEIETCRIVKPLHPFLDQAVIKAVRSTVFLPGVKDGKKTSMQVDLPILFKDGKVSRDMSAIQIPKD